MIAFDVETIARYRACGAWGTQTLYDLLAARSDAAPDGQALVDAPNKAVWCDLPPARWTWRTLRARCDALAWALARGGLRRDDVLLVQLPNVAEFVLLHLACARLGVIVSPLHTQQREHELARCAAQAQPRAMLSLRRIGKSDQVALLARLAPPCPVLWLEDLCGEPPAPAAEREALLAAQAARWPVTADDLHTLCWTSGTEGEPKGVPRSHNNWISVARRIVTGAGLQPGEVLLNPFPLVAVAGLTVLVPWLLQGGKLVLHQPSDMAVLLQQIRDEGAHYVCIAPALLNRWLLEPGLVAPGDLATLRTIGSGSGPLDAWTIAEFRRRWNIEIVNFYGSNEGVGLTAGPSRVPDPAQRAVLFPAAGRAGDAWDDALAAHARTRLRDPASGRDIDEPGTPGELVVQGPTVFPGYWRADAAQQARSFTADGYFRTGDMFALEHDPAGRSHYRFLGRYKDIIVRGGMKISPEELDALVVGHPLLREAAFCGFRDAVMGEKVGVVAVPAGERPLVLADITDHLRRQGIAAYKLPEALVCVDALPRNALNKVLRRELRPLFAHVCTTPETETP